MSETERNCEQCGNPCYGGSHWETAEDDILMLCGNCANRIEEWITGDNDLI